MFRSRLRLTSCKIILVTSFVWFIVDVIILAFYFDSLSNIGKAKYMDKTPNKSADTAGKAEALKLNELHFVQVKNKNTIDVTDISMTYKPADLRRWLPAKAVFSQSGKPGEQGTGVQIPPEQDAVMKEKFKLNQFNILASDKISLNRSLMDVRHARLVESDVRVVLLQTIT